MAPNRAAVTWNGCGRPPARSAITSPSSTAVRAREREGGFDHLGHAAGHVVERAREHGHVGAVAMDLHARAVELPLDRRRARAGERGGHVGRGPGQHGRQRAADGEPHGAQPVEAVGERDRRHGRQVAAERERAAHLGGGHARRLAPPRRP